MFSKVASRGGTLLLLIVLLSTISAPLAEAQNYRFSLDRNITHVYINKDGSILVDYQLTFTCDRGAQAIDIVDIGLPSGDYDLRSVAASIGGASLKDIRPSEYVKPGVEVHLGRYTIQPGRSGTLHVQAKVAHMVYQDSKDKDYASVEFSPTWFGSQYVHGRTYLEVNFHFPEGVTGDETRYHDQRFTKATMVDGRVVFTWIKEDAQGDRQYKYGVSFPKKYVDVVYKPPVIDLSAVGRWIGQAVGSLFSGSMCWIILFFAFIVFSSLLSGTSQRRRRMGYLPPALSVEGVGIKRGLTAVEAAILLETPLNKVLTMILFGLLKKGAVTVLSDKPLQLELNPQVPEGLYEYEKTFLSAVKDDGTLEESRLKTVVIDLIQEVNTKVKGFSRRDTVAYYKDIVRRAWEEVAAAETPEVKSQRFDEALQWMMLDEEFGDRTEKTFREGPVYVPIWWGRYRPWATATPSGAPAARPSGAPSSKGGGGLSLPTLPGAAFANTIVTGIEGISNRVVGSLESFTGGVTQVTNPPPVPSSSRGSGGGGYSCACACACAGCACACAGGGR